MNKIIYKIFFMKWLLIICSLFTDNVFCAEEEDIKFRRIAIPDCEDKFTVSCLLYTKEFLKPSDPKFAGVALIFGELLMEGRTPITEDDRDTMEGGFSFPPDMLAQLPLLRICSTKKPVVFDIGAGSGNDSIMALLAGASRVIAFDIYKQQLAVCKERVSRILSKFPELKNFNTYKMDFSIAGIVPAQYIGKIHVINANRVIHFMDKGETETFLGNAHSMLADGGYLFITASLPTQAHQTPGVAYYSITTTVRDRSIVGKSFAIVTKEESGLRSPRFKREVLRESGDVSEVVMYQGRHFHTEETLRNYLDPLFRIVDVTSINCGAGNDFICVIARKKILSSRQ